MWMYFPDTNGVPLEEIAAIFGDADEVAVYERELEFGADELSKSKENEEEKAQVKLVEARV